MKHILEQYVDLQTEIKYLADKIDRVERRLYDLSHDMVSDSVTKGKKGKKPLGTVKISGFPEEEYSRNRNKLLLYRMKMDLFRDELTRELLEVEEYIESIEDSRVRTIIRLRYIEGMTWQQVADYIGGEHTEDSVRKAAGRFFEKKQEKI